MSIQLKMEKKLQDYFDPFYLRVVNNSHLHKGHAGDDGSGESHFYIEMQSDMLKNLGRLDRQRAVYDVLSEELKVIHALSLKL